MDEIDYKIADNTKLIYYLLDKFNLSNDQDAESYAYEALYKAIITYKEDSGASLGTYATCVISNRLRGHLRYKNRKRQLNCVSLYTPLEGETEDLYLIDTIASSVSTEDNIECEELRVAAKKAINKILSGTQSKQQREVILLWLAKSGQASQTEIANTVGVTQAAVSRTISNFKHKLFVELEDYL